MSEIQNDKTVYSLLEVTKSIQKTIGERYRSSFWVKAEMNKLNYYKQSGHCYPELLEKQEGRVVAQMRANMWKNDFIQINNKFKKLLNESLMDGIKILFFARVSFDPVHGISLQIIDIDPSYTLGDLEKEKQETIQKLHDDGIFFANKSLTLPLLPQRIAVISVDSSKGYKDFIGKIDSNNGGYRFFRMLFPSILQGEKIIQSISHQLERIKRVQHHFDVVAIIRGGGGDVGLSAYNNYELAKEIALFPIPILTGIGHITNETVTEMVSHKNLITPTDLANYLTQRFQDFETPVKEAEQKIADQSRRILSDHKINFLAEVKLFRSVSQSTMIKNKSELKEQLQYISHEALSIITTKRNLTSLTNDQLKKEAGSFLLPKKETVYLFQQKVLDNALSLLGKEMGNINNLERNVNNMSPNNVLKRGYSITLYKGKALQNPANVIEGDVINTVLSEGTVISTVKLSSNQS